MRKLNFLMAALLVGASFIAGCNGTKEVSQEDAANFSKTPDGKNDGIANMNNDR